MTARRLALGMVLAALSVAAAIVMMHAGDRTAEDPTVAIANQLTCPSCAGQTVAQSDSPVAAGMRQVIAMQVEQGRTSEQVRQWFVDRYGPGVVRAGGAEVLLWVLPAVIVGAVTLAAIGVVRRRRDEHAGPRAEHRSLADRRRPVFAAVSGLVIAVVVGVGVVGWLIERRAQPSARDPANTASAAVDQLSQAETFEKQGNFAAAVDAYRHAQEISPDPAIRLRLAFALLRSGRPDSATTVAESVQKSVPSDPDAVLILGLAQRATANPEADHTLKRFLDLAPGHPAAAEVRRLLGNQGG
jgi:cytochrome c-type biogenesis protein CcmH/NrfF